MSITKDNKIEASDMSSVINGMSVSEQSITYTKVDGSTGELVLPSTAIIPVGTEWSRMVGKGAPKGGVAYLGQTVTRTMYADLWGYVQRELADSLIEESEWQTLFTSQNGNVPYYSKGDGSTTFRMPCISGYIKGANAVSEVGQYTPEGLPNITGHVRAYSSFNKGNASFVTQGVSGAFYWQTEWDDDSNKVLATSQNVTSGTADTIRNVPFDASRSNSIYGNSTHVTPETVAVLFGVYAIGTVVSIGEATEEGIVAELGNISSSAVMVYGNQIINGNKRFTDATFDDHFSMYDGTTKRTVMTMKYDGSTYGSDLIIGAGSNIFVGSGESHTGMYNIIGAANGGETTYICSDNDIVFYTNCQTPANAKKFVLGKDGSGLGTSIQTGMVVAFAANAVPSGGYLLCNGAAVSRTTYADLFSAIGTTYGTGDGSTTFNLPNLTNKFVMGSGTAGTVKAAGLPNITGWMIPSDGRGGDSSGAFYKEAISDDWTEKGSGGTGYKWHINANRSSSIYGASSTVQPPALTMRFYIKY